MFSLIVALLCSISQTHAQAGGPQEGAKYLQDVLRVKVSQDGSSVVVHTIAIAVETQEAAIKLSNFPIAFADPNPKFKLLKATIRNGTNTYDSTEVQKSTLASGGEGVRQRAVYVVRLPRLHVGSEFTIEYQVTNKPIAPGIFEEITAVSNESIADNEAQIYESPAKLKYLTKDFDKYFGAKESREGAKYLINFYPSFPAHMTAGHEKHVAMYAVSNGASWGQIKEAITPKYEAALKAPLPPEFQKIVKEASAEKDDSKKIETAVKELQALINYSGDYTTERGRYYPSGHAEVVKNGRGDCKDYATSMVAILRAMNFKAHVALTLMGDNQLLSLFANQPMLSVFNHAMVEAQDKSGKTLWLDPTNPIFAADSLPAPLLGSYALVLDGSNEGLKPLPAKNPGLAEIKVTQDVVVKRDNSVVVNSQFHLNALAYNPISMVESKLGEEGLNRLFARLINPNSHGSAVAKKENSDEDIVYSVRFKANDWIKEETGKISALYLNFPAALVGSNTAPDGTIRLGDEGSFEVTTHILGKKAIDPVYQECFTRSQWIDADRKVEITEEGMDVSDRVVVKKSQITKDEQKSDEFSTLAADIRSCIVRSNLITFRSPTQLTLQEVSQKKLKGPPVGSMTAADAERLENEPSLALRDYIQQKLFDYYSLQIKKSPDKLENYARRGAIVRQMGYLSDSQFVPGFVAESLADVEEGRKRSKGTFNAELTAEYIMDLRAEGKANEANAEFKTLLEKDPHSFATALLGYRLDEDAKAYPAALIWIQHAQKAAKKPSDAWLAQRYLAFCLGDLKRNTEAIAEWQKILARPGASAWDYHNLATIYFNQKNYDKVIELEGKALKLQELGVAKSTLADAYFYKGLALVPTQPEKAEELFRSSIRWNENWHSLIQIADLIMKRFHKTHDQNLIAEGRTFLDRALAMGKKDDFQEQLLVMYDLASHEQRAPTGK